MIDDLHGSEVADGIDLIFDELVKLITERAFKVCKDVVISIARVIQQFLGKFEMICGRDLGNFGDFVCLPTDFESCISQA